MVHILTLGGSPSPPSRSTGVLAYARHYLDEHGFQTSALNMRDLDSEELLCGKFDGPTMQHAKTLVAAADALIIGIPVYKAAYTGLLKVFFDLLPPHALSNKTVLPVTTGSTLAHLLALDDALKPVLANLGAAHIGAGICLLDQEIDLTANHDIRFTGRDAEQRLITALNALMECLAGEKQPHDPRAVRLN